MQEKIKKYYIYCIQNIKNNKIYIGRTYSYKRRWSAEICAAFDISNRDYNTILSKAFRKYAQNKKNIKKFFTFQVIEIFENFNESCDAEKFWIEYFRTNVTKYGPNAGYNLTEGGEGAVGYKQTEEHKRKKFEKSHRGEKCKTSKLKQFEVDEIRKLYLLENISWKNLSIKYNVSKNLIGKIIKNEVWKNDNYQYNQDVVNTIKKQKEIGKNTFKNSKINFEIAEKIRNEYNNTNKKYGLIIILSKKYNISKSNINEIINNKIWIKK